MADDFEIQCEECDSLRAYVDQAEKHCKTIEKRIVKDYPAMYFQNAQAAHAEYRTARDALRKVEAKFKKHWEARHRRSA